MVCAWFLPLGQGGDDPKQSGMVSLTVVNVKGNENLVSNLVIDFEEVARRHIVLTHDPS